MSEEEFQMFNSMVKMDAIFSSADRFSIAVLAFWFNLLHRLMLEDKLDERDLDQIVTRIDTLYEVAMQTPEGKAYHLGPKFQSHVKELTRRLS